MSKINLLPWRDAVQKIQNRIFVGLLLACVLSAMVMVVLVHILIAHEIANEQKNMTYLESQKTELQEKVLELLKLQETKKMLLHQMQVIQLLQGDRISMAKLLDMLARSVSEGAFFTELTRKEITDLPKETELTKTQVNPIGHVAANENGGDEDATHKKALDNLYKQYQIEIVGLAQSNASITEFLKNLENEKWFTDVQLSEVSRNKNGRDLNFKINLRHTIAEVK